MFILLYSAAQDSAGTRSFLAFDNESDLASMIVNHYEGFLSIKVDDGIIEYDLDKLYGYIDQSFDELVCLERTQIGDDLTDLWAPLSTCWVKDAIYRYMKSQCQEEDDDDDVQLLD